MSAILWGCFRKFGRRKRWRSATREVVFENVFLKNSMGTLWCCLLETNPWETVVLTDFCVFHIFTRQRVTLYGMYFSKKAWFWDRFGPLSFWFLLWIYSGFGSILAYASKNFSIIKARACAKEDLKHFVPFFLNFIFQTAKKNYVWQFCVLLYALPPPPWKWNSPSVCWRVRGRGGRHRKEFSFSVDLFSGIMWENKGVLPTDAETVNEIVGALAPAIFCTQGGNPSITFLWWWYHYVPVLI